MARSHDDQSDVLRGKGEEQAHGPAISQHSQPSSGWSPFSSATDDRTLVARKRLLKAQQLAVVRVSSSSGSEAAAIVFSLVTQLAAHWAFAPASCQDLEDVVDALLRLFLAANTFERLGA